MVERIIVWCPRCGDEKVATFWGEDLPAWYCGTCGIASAVDKWLRDKEEAPW
jgi:ribosomal protein S27AE